MQDLQIRLLGGVGAVVDGDEPVDLGSAKCKAVLAALALSPGAAVPVGRLVELVWGDDPPRTADKTLQSYVARLRKAIGADAITRTGGAYRLEVDPLAVDVGRFSAHLDRGDIDAALAEWGGTPLAGLQAGALAASVDGLTERWLGALELDLERRVDTDPAGAIVTLTELTADHPFREGLWALLMTALYRVDRQADALATYRRARTMLVEQLGVEPGPRLQELESLILDQAEQLDGERPGQAGRPATSEPARPTGTVTFAFCDVEGSTRLWAADRDKTTGAMARLEEIVGTAVADHYGYIFATGGDSFGVAFHRAAEAVAWATALQATMRIEPWPGGVEIRLRIGLHTGEAEERAGNYYGPVVNTAARVAAAGHGDQTVITATTVALLDAADVADLVELGAHRLKDLSAEVTLWQLGTSPFPALRTLDRARHNLPVQTTELFGREQHVSAVIALVGAHRLTTLTGVGGAGKTRLALAAAAELVAEFPDGVFFVPLAGTDRPDEVVGAVGAAVGMTVGANDGASVASFIASRRLLVVIDNCEHVIDAVAELVDATLRSGADGRVLATSREVLDIDGEQVYIVPPLDGATIDSPGVALLVDRGLRTRPDLDVGVAARRAMVEIASRLDGIPLALELAAGQLAHLSPVELAERLDDRFEFAAGGRRGRREHLRTLQAMMDWSWDLLDDDERRLLGQLSVFAGGWTLDAAERVGRVASDAPIAVLLGSLVQKSLVATELASGRSRYRLLETVRLYGLQKLEAADDLEAARDRHARYFCEAADAVAFSERFNLPRLAVRWAAEVENIVAVVDWLRSRGRLEDAAALLTMPALTWRFLPAPKPLLAAIDELLAEPVDDRRRLLLLIASAEATLGRRGMSGGGRRARQLVDLARSSGDDAVASGALMAIGSSYGATNPDLAEELLSEALDRAVAVGDDRQEANALAMLAGVEAFGRREFTTARLLLDRARSKASPDGIENHVIASQETTLEVMAGDWEAANAGYERLLVSHADLGHPVSWYDAIDDAVFAAELGRPRHRPLATAVAELEAVGGTADWPDLLMIPLGDACRRADWDRAARIVATVRAATREGRRLAIPHATAYFFQYRQQLPREHLVARIVEPASVAELIAEELQREREAGASP